MTDDQAPEARRRSKKWWILGVVILLLLPLTAFGWSAWITHSYVQDVERWEQDEKPKLMSNDSFMPITAMDYPGPVDTESRQAQEEGCTRLGEKRKTLKAAAAALPEIADRPLLPWLNPDYKLALENDERRQRLVSAYQADADQVLDAMQRDCAFDSKWLAEVQRYNDLREDADRKTDAKGSSSDGSICEFKAGCIPANPTKLTAFARLMTKAHQHERSEVLALYQTASCERTSYADACDSIADEYKAYLDVDREYIRLIVPGGYSEINAAVKRSNRAWKKFERRTLKILESQHSGLGSVSTFTDDPTSADAFFAGVAKLKTRELLKRKATVNNELVKR